MVLPKSAYWDFPDNPKPAGTHLDLWLSLSKHSTYTFNPDGEPILPDVLAIGVFESIYEEEFHIRRARLRAASDSVA